MRLVNGFIREGVGGGGGYATWNGWKDEQLRGSYKEQGVTFSYFWFSEAVSGRDACQKVHGTRTHRTSNKISNPD